MPKIEKRSGGLGGGSGGEFVKQYGSPFFHPGIPAIKLLTKNVYEVRLLPAFDYNIDPSDPAFAVGFVPYRDAGAEVNSETGFHPFTPWYFSAKGYEFVGTEGRGFLSPLSEYDREERGIDPLYDVWLTAKNHNNPDYKALTEKPKDIRGEYNAVVEKPRWFVFYNVLINIDGNMENRIAITKIKALDLLKETLDYPRPASVKQIITPEWPDFLYGDPTDPLTGLLATAIRTPFGDGFGETSAFHFSSKANRLDGSRSYSFDPNTEMGQGILAGRKNIPDLETVARITPATEILEFIVNDGFLPYELIQEACERNWTMPSKPVGRTYSTPGSAPEDAGETTHTFARPTAKAAPVGRPAPGAATSARPAALPPRPGAIAPTAAARPLPGASANPAPAASTRSVPTAAARPAATAARPPAASTRPAPAASNGRPPVAAARTAAPGARPAAAVRTVAPTPSPAAVVPPDDTAAEAAAGLAPAETAPVEPLTPEETAWYNEACNMMEAGGMPDMSAEDLSYFSGLQDRVSALALGT